MGVFPNVSSSAVKAKSAAYGAIVANGAVDIVVTWDTPFADANYTVAAIPFDVESPGAGGAIARNLRAKTPQDCTIRVTTGSVALTGGTLLVIGAHA